MSGTTPNLSLVKPERGVTPWDPEMNRNMDVIDLAISGALDTANGAMNTASNAMDQVVLQNSEMDSLRADMLSLPAMVTLAGNFSGGGTVISLPRAVTSVAEYFVSVTVNANDPNVGNVGVVKGTSSFTVYRSGSSTGTFEARIEYLGLANAYGSQIYRQWIAATAAGDHSDPSFVGGLAWIDVQADGAKADVILMGSCVYAFEDDYDLPRNLHLKPQEGSLISVAAGKTVSIAKMSAGEQVLFMGDGTVKFQPGSVEAVRAIWFGAEPYEETVAVGSFSKALVSAPEYGLVRGSLGTYDFGTETLEWNRNVHLYMLGSTVVYNGTSTPFRFTSGGEGAPITMYKVHVWMPTIIRDADDWTNPTYGIEVKRVQSSRFYRVDISGFFSGIALLPNPTETSGGPCTYNEFFVDNIKNCKYSAYLKPSVNDQGDYAYPNQNRFKGGRWWHGLNHTAEVAKHVYVSNETGHAVYPTYRVNGNDWDGCSFEGQDISIQAPRNITAIDAATKTLTMRTTTGIVDGSQVVVAGTVSNNGLKTVVSHTSTAIVVSETVYDEGSTKIASAFAASTKTITVNNTSGLVNGKSIIVEGSGSNNRTFTIVSTAANSIVVAEPLVDESGAAASVYQIIGTAASAVSFNGATGVISLPSTTGVVDGGHIQVEGSNYNNQVLQVSSHTSDTITVSLGDVLVTEAAGRSITVTAYPHLVFHVQGDFNRIRGGRMEGSQTGINEGNKNDYPLMGVPYSALSRIKNKGSNASIETGNGVYRSFLPGSSMKKGDRGGMNLVFQDIYGALNIANTNSVGNEIIRGMAADEETKRFGLCASGKTIYYDSSGNEIVTVTPGSNVLTLNAGDRWDLDRVRFVPLAAAPVSPSSGDVVYANGTGWDPGGGSGLYVRKGSTWTKIA